MVSGIKNIRTPWTENGWCDRYKGWCETEDTKSVWPEKRDLHCTNGNTKGQDINKKDGPKLTVRRRVSQEVKNLSNRINGLDLFEKEQG